MRQYIVNDKLTRNHIQSLLTFPQESLILSTREHPVLLAIRLLQIGILGLVLLVAVPIISYFLTGNLLFALQIIAILIAGITGLFIRETVHWYFHIYTITNHKIIEIRYSPLSSEISNSILLDQLRCTEIDAELHGFIAELFDIGNVTITFDRPTHQEEFTLKNIRSPRKTANLLSSKLHMLPQDNKSMWTRTSGRQQYTYLEEDNARTILN